MWNFLIPLDFVVVKAVVLRNLRPELLVEGAEEEEDKKRSVPAAIAGARVLRGKLCRNNKCVPHCR